MWFVVNSVCMNTCDLPLPLVWIQIGGFPLHLIADMTAPLSPGSAMRLTSVNTRKIITHFILKHTSQWLNSFKNNHISSKRLLCMIK